MLFVIITIPSDVKLNVNIAMECIVNVRNEFMQSKTPCEDFELHFLLVM